MKVFGTVKDAANEMPLRGAKISLFVGERELAVLKSDREGKFEHKETASYIGETLICKVGKKRYDTQEISYKVEGEEVSLNIELIPKKEEEIMKEPSKKWPKIAAGIASVVVLVALIYLLITTSQLKIVPSQLKSKLSQFETKISQLEKSALGTEGSIAAFAMDKPPEGWLECNGQAISRTKYERLFKCVGIKFGPGDGIDTFNVPDLRGEFIRGWDHERGLDPERKFGSYQLDQMQSHSHIDKGHKHISTSSQNGNHFHLLPGIVKKTRVRYEVRIQPGFGTGLRGTPTPKSASFGIHKHTIFVNNSNAKLGDPSTSTQGSPRHGKETRPRNLALMYCIKY